MRVSAASGRRLRLLSVGALASLVGFGAVTSPSGASAGTTGVGIGAAPIVVAEPVEPGAPTASSPVTVVNTGTESATVRIWIDQEPGSDARAVPADWVELEREAVDLAPGESTVVPLTVTAPRDAAAGDYQGLVYVGAVVGDVADNRIGAQAATRLELTVAPRAAEPVVAAPSSGGLGRWAVTAAVVAAVLVALFAAVLVVRRRHRFTYQPAN